MMIPRILKLAAASATLLCIAEPSTGVAQSGALRPSMIVSTAWLAEHARDANLVVLQVGNRAQYDSVHIPGARAVALADIQLTAAETKLSLELPPPARLKAWAENLGIGNNTRIVVVPQDSVLQSATRVFLTLAYMGAMDRTSLLNGGLPAWKAEARPVSAEVTVPAKPAVFELKLRPELIAAMQDVEKAIQDNRVSVIDARLPRFFNGDGGGYPRAGHIPNAKNIPLTTVSANGFLKDETALRQLFTSAGASAGSPVITYCHIGQQASLLWFVATMLGYDAKMYDGSFQEWSGTERLTVIGKP
ncbi:MAG: sulfurtransferase [Phycisphaerae bacterium]|nr:sulfurtransferase [Gemmatimonadaceae bacterium]